MTVVAQRGDHTFMLLVSGSPDALADATVRIFDQRYGRLGEEVSGLSVLARGYWDEVEKGVDTAAVVSAAEAVLAGAAA